MSNFTDKYGNVYARDPNGGFHVESVSTTLPNGSWTDDNGITWYRDPNGGYHLTPSNPNDFVNDGSSVLNAKSIYSDGGLITSNGSGTLSVKELLVNGTSLSGNYLEKSFSAEQDLLLNGYQFGIYSDSTKKLGSIISSSSSTNTNTIEFVNNTGNQYDASIVVSGGTSGTNGEGTVNLTAKNFYISPVNDSDNSNQVSTTKYVQDNLANYLPLTTFNSDIANYLTKADAVASYVPLSTTNYTFSCTPNTTMILNGTSITDTSPTITLSASTTLSLNSPLVKMSSLPTTDPGISGALWNDNGFVVMSGSNADSIIKKYAHIIAFATTPPSSSEIISVWVADQTYYLPANFVGSAVSVEVPPETNYTFSIQQNYTTIGTIIISTSGTVTMSTTSQTAITLSSKDTIAIVGQDTAVTNMKNITINLLLNQTLG